MAQLVPAPANVPLALPYATFTADAAGIINFTTYIRNQATSQTSYRIAPIVATYSRKEQRDSCIRNTTPGVQQQAVAAGVSVNSVLQYFPSGQGGVGAVVSFLSNATQWWQPANNNSHAVGVLRQGNTIWIFDPQYVMGSATRLPSIRGLRNVTRMLQAPSFSSVTMIQVQGIGNTRAECMGRTAEWIDNVAQAPGALSPYPPNTFVPGQLTTGWETVAKN